MSHEDGNCEHHGGHGDAACVDDNGCTGKVCFDGHVDDEYEDARWSQ